MRSKVKEFGTDIFLKASSIDQCAEEIMGFLENIGTEKQESIRIRISVEEILLEWQAHFGENTQMRYSCYTYLGQPTIQLRLVGVPYDPLEAAGAGDETDWSRKLLAGLRTTPVYSYAQNTNQVTFKLVRKRISPVYLLLLAVAAGVLIGFAGNLLLPMSFRTAAAENLLVPVSNTYISVLDFFGIPLIFLSVILGICGVGDATFFGRIGKKMIMNFMLTLLIVTVLAAIVIAPFFHVTLGGGTLDIAYRDFIDMILGFLPTSLVKPFIDCNAMQLIIMGVVMGIAVLKLNPVTTRFSEVMSDLNRILLLISQWFTRIIPLFVTIILVKSIWTGEIGEVLTAWKSWVITTGLQAAALTFMMVQISVKHKVKIGTIIRKISATFLIAFGTNSCGATIPEIYSCTARLGVNSRVMGFGIPIGTSIFKPSTAIRLVSLAYFMAAAYGVDTSVKWVILVAILSMILSIAVPAIPGGTMLFYPMFFAQLGIPAEAITAMLATDIFFDATCTAFCQVSTELALVSQAGKMDLLDEDALREI